MTDADEPRESLTAQVTIARGQVVLRLWSEASGRIVIELEVPPASPPGAD